MDLPFYVSTIEINADGYRASQAQYKLRHHVNMQLIKIPTTSYVNATKRWGHDFTRNRGVIQPIDPIVLSQMSKGEPIKLSTFHFVFCAQSFIYSRNWLR